MLRGAVINPKPAGKINLDLLASILHKSIDFMPCWFSHSVSIIVMPEQGLTSDNHATSQLALRQVRDFNSKAEESFKIFQYMYFSNGY